MAAFEADNYAMVSSPASSISTAEVQDGDETVDFSQDPFFFPPPPVTKTDGIHDQSSFKPMSLQTQLDPFAPLEVKKNINARIQ